MNAFYQILYYFFHSLIVRRRGEPPPASAYKLLTSVVNNEDNKMAVRKMLWKHTENLGIPLNEKLLSAAAYKTILQSPGKLYKDSYNLCV